MDEDEVLIDDAPAGDDAGPPLPLPDQHEFFKMPAKFGHVPVAEEPLGWDPKHAFDRLYPPVHLPVQVVERYAFGSPELEPNQLFFGDNLHVMRSLPNESIDLIYIDPPFFSGRNYNVLFGDQNEIRSFKDIWEGGMNGYLVWFNARLYEMKRLLKPTGSLFVHLDWHASHYVKVELDKLFGYERFQNEIIWYYSGGGASKKRFARKHDAILWYTRGSKHTFNVDAVRVPYKWTDGQKRADGSERDLDKGKLPDDVLEQHALMPWAKEAIGYPTQKPEALVEKFVLGASNEGDVVADFFSGGGTTAAVAERLGRRWIASDISRVAVSITADRVASVVEKQQADASAAGKSVAVPDFQVKHWGVYEIEGLAKMSADDFRGFVLAAFEARPDSTDGLIHGYKGKEPIYVGSPDPQVSIRKENVAEFGNAVLARRGSGAAATMIGWAFSQPAKQMAERIAAQQKLELSFVKLRLLPLESPDFAAHIAAKHDRYVDLLSFVLPPVIKVKESKVGELTYRFDLAESIALNPGAKLINAQWDFEYATNFTSSPGMSLNQTKDGVVELAAEHQFPVAGEYEIAVRLQDDLGGEATRSWTVTVG